MKFAELMLSLVFLSVPSLANYLKLASDLPAAIDGERRSV